MASPVAAKAQAPPKGRAPGADGVAGEEHAGEQDQRIAGRDGHRREARRGRAAQALESGPGVFGRRVMRVLSRLINLGAEYERSRGDVLQRRDGEARNNAGDKGRPPGGARSRVA